MNESFFIEIPVIQTLENGETRIVMELISPNYIVRISQAQNSTIIWLYQTPFLKTPLTYQEIVKQLQQLKVEEHDNFGESLTDFIKRVFGKVSSFFYLLSWKLGF